MTILSDFFIVSLVKPRPNAVPVNRDLPDRMESPVCLARTEILESGRENQDSLDRTPSYMTVCCLSHPNVPVRLLPEWLDLQVRRAPMGLQGTPGRMETMELLDRKDPKDLLDNRVSLVNLDREDLQANRASSCRELMLLLGLLELQAGLDHQEFLAKLDRLAVMENLDLSERPENRVSTHF